VLHRAAAIVVLLAGLCGVAKAQNSTPSVDVTGTRVSLIPPAGFELADRFPGFVGPNGVSVQVTEIAGPFKAVSEGFSNPELASKQGMTIVAPPHAITLADGTPALWIHLRQDYRGESYLKWVVVWGNASASVLLVGTVPKRYESGAEAMFRQSFMTARWKPAPPSAPIDVAGLPFLLRPAPGWQFVMRTGATVTVGLAGTRLPDKTGAPMLIAAASTEMVPAPNLAATAVGLFKSITPDLYRDRVMRTNRPTRIAGKPAHELVGTALHHAGYPIALYLVVVADGVGHLQLVGICRLDEESNYFPAFREMVGNLSLLSR
jgi:hypothetical protein